jgi:DNA-binding LytR/AlgR family response regulator
MTSVQTADRAMRPAPARAVIAEDESVLREELRAHVEALWPALEICAEVADGPAALDALEAHRPDLMFLDIQMPGLSGIDVARQASGRCHVAFVTAHDEYAVAAFEQGAVDYVMKPFSRERLAVAIERIRARLASPPANLEGLLATLVRQMPHRQSYLRWINASLGNDLRLITVDEVCYFRSDSKYTRIVTAAQESLIRKPVRELAQELDPDLFRQIHRSIIVNVAEIARVQRDFRGHIELRLKHRPETLPVSQPYAASFRQM